MDLLSFPLSPTHGLTMRSKRFPPTILVACFLLAGSVIATTRASDPGQEFFEKKIRPVLVDRCYKCHSAEAETVQGGLLLDSREASRRGGDSGAAVVPGDASASLLLSALRYEALEMPPDGKLADGVIADFEQWIKAGAPDPRDASTTAPRPTEINWEEARNFWSFQPPQRQTLPVNVASELVRQPIDAFILSRLAEAGLTPNLEADRRTLARRVHFDLVGLPPTPDEIDAFVHDSSPNAYERMVDRLLASPRYGEHWARLWLDLARFAEDQAHIVGNDRSLCYPNAYLYRDWVIRTLNDDLPYDEFVRRQLAADLLAPVDQAEHVALGFIGLGPKYYRRNSPEVMAEEWEDRVDSVARGLLGLTVACARCHDHKFDPIPTADYYAFAGIFASTEMFNRPFDAQRELAENGQAKKVEEALHIVRDVEPRDLPIHIRGDVNKPGAVVKRRFPQILSTSSMSDFNQGSGRRELAEAIVDRHNPLTARVIVNRVWGWHFARPLVSTPSNFGHLGERPTHPELLDDLAVRFMDSGWSLKWLQREIVLSATYRQSSDVDAAKSAIDPANRWLWRMNRRRLSVEAWRDAILSVSGRLDTTIGGSSMQPQQPEERRRTVYSEVSRLKVDALLALFDFPDPNTHSPVRHETTTPLQKLFVLNSPFSAFQAEAFAQRIVSSATVDQERIHVAYRLAYGREPSGDELRLGERFVSDRSQPDEWSRWTQYAQALLAANEMFMVD